MTINGQSEIEDEMPINFADITNYLKIAPKYLFAVALTFSTVLLSPAMSSMLGLAPLVTKYWGYIGAICLLSWALLISHALFFLKETLSKRITTFLKRRRMCGALKTLSPREKEYLSRYIINETKTQTFALEDGIAQGLVRSGVIYRSSSIGYSDCSFAYNLYPWIWEELNRKSGLLMPEMEKAIAELERSKEKMVFRR